MSRKELARQKKERENRFVGGLELVAITDRATQEVTFELRSKFKRPAIYIPWLCDAPSAK